MALQFLRKYPQDDFAILGISILFLISLFFEFFYKIVVVFFFLVETDLLYLYLSTFDRHLKPHYRFLYFSFLYNSHNPILHPNQAFYFSKCFSTFSYHKKGHFISGMCFSGQIFQVSMIAGYY